jgi:antitoxin component of RelBE/YafQ-DinJ toxin-antitoxin module
MKPENKNVAAQAKQIESSPDERAAFDGEEPNVTPEEQQQYDTIVYKAMEMLYSDDRIVPMLEKLKAGANNISKEIGHTAAMVMTSLVQTVAQSDQEIPEEILYNAGQEVVSQIVDIATAAGIVSEEQSQDVAEAALYEGLRIWGQNMGRDGQITDARAIEAKQSLTQAGIEQDISKIPGRGQAEQPPPAGPSGQPPTQPGPPQAGPPQARPPQMGGIVNQAAGAQQ